MNESLEKLLKESLPELLEDFCGKITLGLPVIISERIRRGITRWISKATLVDILSLNPKCYHSELESFKFKDYERNLKVNGEERIEKFLQKSLELNLVNNFWRIFLRESQENITIFRNLSNPLRNICKKKSWKSQPWINFLDKFVYELSETQSHSHNILRNS